MKGTTGSVITSCLFRLLIGLLGIQGDASLKTVSSLLFVYGTLMPGHAPACVRNLVGRFIPVGPATIRGTLYDMRSYPALLLNSRAVVHGHLCELPDDDVLWRRLDTYEGYDPKRAEGSLFRRVSAVATLSDGQDVDCQTYVYNFAVGTAPVVASGDWVRRGE